MELDDFFLGMATDSAEAEAAAAQAKARAEEAAAAQAKAKVQAEAVEAAAAAAVLPAAQAARAPGHSFQDWVALHNTLSTRVCSAMELLRLEAKLGPAEHGTCMHRKNQDADVCGAEVRRPNCRRLKEPYRANMCPDCRRKNDGQPRYSPTAGSTVTFLEHTPATLQHLLACTDKDQLTTTLGALDNVGGGFAIVRDRINCSNSRIHLAVHEATNGDQQTHIFGLAGKVAGGRLVRVFETDVRCVTVIDPTTSAVQHYSIQRLHGIVDGVNVDGTPLAMRIA